MKTRIYITEPFRPMNIPMLIEATSASQASRFVSDQLFAVRPATGHEIANLMGAGHKVEAAGKATAAPAATGAYLPASKAGESGNG